MHIDEQALRSSLQWLRQATFDTDVAVVMKRAVNSVHRVFGCNGSGTMFITESGRLSYVAASDEAGRQLEEAQAAAGQGPCYDSYVYASEIASADLHADERWPELPAHLPPQVRAVAGFPSCSAAARSAHSTSIATSPPNGTAPTSRPCVPTAT